MSIHTDAVVTGLSSLLEVRARYARRTCQEPVNRGSGMKPASLYGPPTIAPIPTGIVPGGFAWPSSWAKRAVDACNANLVKQVNQHGKWR